jgi:hypothetical protein
MDGRILRNVVLACLCAGVLSGTPIQAAVYVDGGATGTGDGSSWQNAFPCLQDALAAAAAAAKPVEVRVAQGVYKPDQGTGRTPGDRTATFQLLNGVTLQGGYAGAVAADPNARDVALYETILSGDLAGDDKTGWPSWTDNSFHVVTTSGTDKTAVIDGFTVTAGYSEPTKSQRNREGSGMLIDAGSPRVLNCCFTGNHDWTRGAGVLADNGSNPVLTDCAFLNDDRGMNNTGNSNSVLTHCRFEGNGDDAFSCGSGNPVLVACFFTGNRSYAVSISGGAVALTSCVFERGGTGILFWSGKLTMTDCTITGQTGVGVNALGGNLSLLGCTFAENRGGGGWLVHCAGSLTAQYCRFRDNAGWINGIIAGREMELSDCEFTGNSGFWTSTLESTGDRLIATRCLFAGNSGSLSVISARNTLTRFSNCTFADNRSQYGKPGRWFGIYGIPLELTECIVWNGPDPFPQVPGLPAQITVRYSDVQGGYAGVGNIDADPCFVAPGHWADPNDPNIVLGPEDMNAVWVGGDYHLKSQSGHWDSAGATWVQDEATSPCIDAGDPNLPLGIEPFPNGGWLNLGAYGGSAQASKSYFGAPVCPVQIPGDINGDCRVDATDEAILQAHWLMEGAMFVNTPPTVRMTSPEDGAELLYGTQASLRAEATDTDGTVIVVHFYMEYRSNNATSSTMASDFNGVDGWGRELDWKSLDVPDGATCTIWAKAVDDDGATTTSPGIAVICRRQTLSLTPAVPAK